MSTITPFKISVSDAKLSDLRDRLARTVMPSEVESEAWSYGPTNAYMQHAIDRLLGGYDWRAEEAAINRFPQFITEIDGQAIHFIHVKVGRGERHAAAPDPRLARLDRRVRRGH
ncbi:MAG TPA: epoxide hydrolase N-terminal domain-containing protein [Arsenicitalea sp.]|jgi:hypothetical protein|nr:epoxide hydrolase N-terminal domain-containing protein [Arsenicitalea sp.]